jgi:hypothetical protein
VTTVSYPLGRPPAAAMRGGDCRARDLDQDRNVHGGHRFAATTHCRINNGLLRLTVGATGVAPSLTVEARRGRVTVGDVYSDTYSDTYVGSIATPEWIAMGTITIDSPAVSALLTAIRMPRISPGEGRAKGVTIRLVVPAINDIVVVLHRGERVVHIEHGDNRGSTVSTTRRVRWTASPSPVGTASLSRVEEVSPIIASFPRYVGSTDAVTADPAAFSLTAASATSVSFTAGVGTPTVGDRVIDLHRQSADASRPRLVVA